MPFDDSVLHMLIEGRYEEEKLKRELAKTNYLYIHKKRSKKR